MADRFSFAASWCWPYLPAMLQFHQTQNRLCGRERGRDGVALGNAGTCMELAVGAVLVCPLSNSLGQKPRVDWPDFSRSREIYLKSAAG